MRLPRRLQRLAMTLSRYAKQEFILVENWLRIWYNTEKEPTKIRANATVVTSDEKEFINLYIKNGDKYELVTDFVLLDGTRVRLLENFDSTAEYTAIKYVVNGEIRTAYVKTKFVQVDGISFEIIIAILLGVLCILFTLILIVVIKKNKKLLK